MSVSGRSERYRRLGTLPSGPHAERTVAEITATGEKVEVVFVSKSAEADRLAAIEAIVESGVRVRHPGIASVLDGGHDEEGRPWLVLEPLVGETLGARLARSPRMSILDVVRSLLVALDALSSAHAASLAHGAISPETIVLVDAARAKLSALGHDLAIGEGTRGAPSAADDARSVARILHAAITGHAIDASSRPARVRGVRAEVPIPLADLIDGVFAEGGASNANELRRALAAAMAKSPVIARLETRTPGSIARRSSAPPPARGLSSAAARPVPIPLRTASSSATAASAKPAPTPVRSTPPPLPTALLRAKTSEDAAYSRAPEPPPFAPRPEEGAAALSAGADTAASSHAAPDGSATSTGPVGPDATSAKSTNPEPESLATADALRPEPATAGRSEATTVEANRNLAPTTATPEAPETASATSASASPASAITTHALSTETTTAKRPAPAVDAASRRSAKPLLIGAAVALAIAAYVVTSSSGPAPAPSAGASRPSAAPGSRGTETAPPPASASTPSNVADTRTNGTASTMAVEVAPAQAVAPSAPPAPSAPTATPPAPVPAPARTMAASERVSAEVVPRATPRTSAAPPAVTPRPPRAPRTTSSAPANSSARAIERDPGF